MVPRPQKQEYFPKYKINADGTKARGQEPQWCDKKKKYFIVRWQERSGKYTRMFTLYKPRPKQKQEYFPVYKTNADGKKARKQTPQWCDKEKKILCCYME